MAENIDDKPVLVVITPDNYLVCAGEPGVRPAKEIAQYALDGCTIKTIPYKEYKALDLEWIYDKPKN